MQSIREFDKNTTYVSFKFCKHSSEISIADINSILREVNYPHINNKYRVDILPALKGKVLCAFDECLRYRTIVVQNTSKVYIDTMT